MAVRSYDLTDSSHIRQMFLFQKTGCDSFRRITRQYRYLGLQDHLAVVQMFINKMNGAAGHFCARFECLPLSIEPGKIRQQTRVNIDDAVWKLGNEPRGKQPHITGEADQFDIVSAQDLGYFAIVFLSGAASAFHNDGRNSSLRGLLHARRIRFVTDDDRHF